MNCETALKIDTIISSIFVFIFSMVDVVFLYYLPLTVLSLIYVRSYKEKNTFNVMDFVTSIVTVISMLIFSLLLTVSSLEIILAVVVAPCVEEITIRGLFFDMVDSISKDKRIAVFVSALIFSVWHSIAYPDIVILTMVFIFGIIFGYFRVRSTLYTCILMHRLFNFFNLVFAFIY